MKAKMMNKRIRAFAKRLTGRKAAGKGLPASRLPRRDERTVTPLSACLGASICLSALAAPVNLLALPQDGRVTAGSASMVYSPSRLEVNQATDKAVIDWRSFNIATGEQTRFNQPSASAMALNRVSGGDPSSILGTLTANGKVMLVNPNGIFFGPGSRVDAGGLVATTADIANEDFLAGNLRFAIPSTVLDASVINQGTITVHEAGLAALVAPAVANSGVIQARLGKVALAAGNTFTLDLYGDQLVQFAVGSPVSEEQSQAAHSLVTNSGLISADGGTVLLTAAAAGRALSQVVNMDGIIEARAVEVGQGGEIILHGGDSGIVSVTGTLDVSAKETGQQGGSVQVLGDKVGLFAGAVIDASGDAGGGEVLVGGDFQGITADVKNAAATYVDEAATITADGLTAGDGGKVIVWADGATRYDGGISARGGSISGDGGFVEVSGEGHLDFTGTVDTSAVNGATGTLLLDPTNIVIANGTGDSGADGNTAFSGDPSGLLGAVMEDDTSPSLLYESELEGIAATNNIVLQAKNNITINNLTDNILNLKTGAGNSVTFTANADANGGGAFSMAAGDRIKTAGGAVSIAGAGLTRVSVEASGADVSLESSKSAVIARITSSTVHIDAAENITDSNSAIINVSGQGVLTAGGAITLGDTAADSVNFGSLAATAATSLTINENSNMLVDQLSAASASLASTGAITDSASATINVSGKGVLTAGGSITLGDTDTDSVNFGSLAATAATSLTINENSNMLVDQLSAATASLYSTGSIADSASATINVSGKGIFAAGGSITLGDTGTDSVNFGRLDATAVSEVAISENSGMLVNQLSAASAHLLSSGSITDSSSATMNVSGQGVLAASGSITLGDTGTDSVNFGSLAATADTEITISENSDMRLVAVSGTSVNLASTGSIFDADALNELTANATGNQLILQASGSLGEAGDGDLDINSPALTATFAGNIHIANTADFSQLSLISTSIAANVYQIGGDNLTFSVTDNGSVYLLTEVSDTTGLDFSFQGNGDVELGALDVGFGTVILTGNAINDVPGEVDTDITASAVELNALAGIGNNAAINLATQEIEADSITGAINIHNSSAAAATIHSLTTGTGPVTFAQSGGGELLVETITTTNGGIAVSVAGADLDNSGGAITAGGAADMTLTTTGSGSITLGSLNAAGNQVTINAAGAINDDGAGAADLTAAQAVLQATGGIGAGSVLDTALTALWADSANGAINIHNSSAAAATIHSLTTGTGTISFAQSGGGDLLGQTITTTNGGIDISVAGADLDNSGGAVTAGGAADLSLTTTGSGSITLGSLQAAGNLVTINAAGAINDDGAGAADLTAAQADLQAVSGIGAGSALDTAITALWADSITGAINIHNSSAAAATIHSLTTGTGTISFAQSGGGELLGQTITTTNGGIAVSVAGADLDNSGGAIIAGGAADMTLTTTGSGSITLGSLQAAGDQVTINAAGAINDDGAGAIDLTAAQAELQAVSGIGAGSTLDTAVTALWADSANGAIAIHNSSAAAATVHSLTTGTGTISFAQSGGGDLLGQTITTTNGGIAISVAGADLDNSGGAITAGGAADMTLTTTGSGSITLGSLNAAGNQVSINAAGAINDDGAGAADLTAAQAELQAVSGIGAGSALDTALTGLWADSITGAIDIHNSSAAAATVHSLTTGTGPITFAQSGGRSVSLVSVACANGHITLRNTGGPGADMRLGKIAADTTNDTVSVSADGSLSDATADEAPNITAAHFRISKAVDAGGPGNADIDTSIHELTVNANPWLRFLYLEDVDSIQLSRAQTLETLHISCRTGSLSADRVTANHISFTADEMNFTGGSGSIVGQEIFLEPLSKQQNMTIAGTVDTGSGSLDLTATDLAALQDGFTMIAIGRRTGSGQIHIPYNQFAWQDPVTFHVPDGGIATADVSDFVTKPYADDPAGYNILTGRDNASFTFTTDSPATFWLNGNIKTGSPDAANDKIDNTLGGDVFIDARITTVLRPGDLNVFSKVTNSVIAIDTDGGNITFGSMLGPSTYLMLLAGISETVVDGGAINGAVEVYGLRLSGSGGELGVKITSVDNIYSQDKWPAVYTIVTLPTPHYGNFTFNNLPVRGLPIDRDPQNAFLLGQMTFFSSKGEELFAIESYALPEEDTGEGEEENEDEASDTTPSEAGFGLTGTEEEAEQ